MPRPTNHISYTSAWASIVIEHPGATPIRLPLASEREARGVRLTFYSWRRALERRDPELFTRAAPLTLRIETTPDGRATLVIEHVDHTAAARALYAALDAAKLLAGPTAAPGEPVPKRESHDDLIARLMGLGAQAPASDDTPQDNGAIAPSEKVP